MSQTFLNKTQNDGIVIESYENDYRNIWNNFVSKAKNGIFLFDRNYLEYHSNRFVDHSLLFYHKNRLIAVLPANKEKDDLHSHGGLTFGGIVSFDGMKTCLMLSIFRSLIKHCQNQGINRIIYKPIPYIYHSTPADEDLYALFVNQAKLMSRNVSSCIYIPKARRFDYNRYDNIRKAKKHNLTVKENHDFSSFMMIEKEALNNRHGVRPVHSVEEIKLLAERFPNNIKLFSSFLENRMLAGIIIYESMNVAHMQYASNSKEGWNKGAQDIIEDYLINDYYRNKKYFDFGISTENLGRLLNVGLISRKENFGASAVMYDSYQLSLY